MLIKYSGKYVKIYFNMKITFLVRLGALKTLITCVILQSRLQCPTKRRQNHQQSAHCCGRGHNQVCHRQESKERRSMLAFGKT